MNVNISAMKPWDKQLDEKLQQALNRLEGSVTDAQWLRLSQNLDALDKENAEDDEKVGGALDGVKGEVTDKQWFRLSDQLDEIDKLKRQKKGAIWFTALLTCMLTTAVLTGWWYWDSQTHTQPVAQQHTETGKTDEDGPLNSRYKAPADIRDIPEDIPARTPKSATEKPANHAGKPGQVIKNSQPSGNPGNYTYSDPALPTGNTTSGNPWANNPQLVPGVLPATDFNPDQLSYNQVPQFVHQYIPGSLPLINPLAAGAPVKPGRSTDPKPSLPRLYLQFGAVSEYNMNKPTGNQREGYVHKDAKTLENQQVKNGFTVGLKALAGYRLGNRIRFNVGLSLQQQVEKSEVNYTYKQVPFRDTSRPYYRLFHPSANRMESI